MRTWPALEIAAPDDLVQAALTDFPIAAIDDNEPERWLVFFQTRESRDRAAAELRDQFQGLNVAAVDVPDEDWAARSQADLQAVRVGNIIVAPPWDVGTAEAPPHMTVDTGAATSVGRAFTIVIQPSMGFGTGHHATTRLCLAHLQQLDLRNQTVVDVGTGSGVLAIAASRLGATHVLAIDDDPDAIQSARENIDLNPGAEVTLGLIDFRRVTLRPFDVIMANLTGGMLTAAAPALFSLCAATGRFILSGFLESEAHDVLAAFAGCSIDRRSREGEWGCVTLTRR